MSKKDGIASSFDAENPADIALLWLAKKHWFKVYLVISFGFAIAEPILVSWGDQTIVAQIIVLGISSALFLFGYIATVLSMSPKVPFFSRLRKAVLAETWLEIFAFAIGWGLIFRDPSIACLRCFRVYRFVWYSEFYRAENGSPFYILTFFAHIILQYLEKMGQELFTLSSKGGVVVLGFFFYMAYVVGVAFWWKTANLLLISPEGGPNGNQSECDTLSHCFLIMLRLTFWDGSGFDYLKSIMDSGAAGLSALLYIYMCISAMVLLNGLIGIFAGAFQSATAEEEEEIEEKQREAEEEFEELELNTQERIKEVKIKVNSIVPVDENKELKESIQRVEKLSQQLALEIAKLKKQANN